MWLLGVHETIGAALIGAATALVIEFVRLRIDHRERIGGRRRTRSGDNPGGRAGPWPSEEQRP